MYLLNQHYFWFILHNDDHKVAWWTLITCMQGYRRSLYPISGKRRHEGSHNWPTFPVMNITRQWSQLYIYMRIFDYLTYEDFKFHSSYIYDFVKNKSKLLIKYVFEIAEIDIYELLFLFLHSQNKLANWWTH